MGALLYLYTEQSTYITTPNRYAPIDGKIKFDFASEQNKSSLNQIIEKVIIPILFSPVALSFYPLHQHYSSLPNTSAYPIHRCK